VPGVSERVFLAHPKSQNFPFVLAADRSGLFLLSASLSTPAAREAGPRAPTTIVAAGGVAPLSLSVKELCWGACVSTRDKSLLFRGFF
jgi:hypothetical protein